MQGFLERLPQNLLPDQLNSASMTGGRAERCGSRASSYLSWAIFNLLVCLSPSSSVSEQIFLWVTGEDLRSFHQPKDMCAFKHHLRLIGFLFCLNHPI